MTLDFESGGIGILKHQNCSDTNGTVLVSKVFLYFPNACCLDNDGFKCFDNISLLYLAGIDEPETQLLQYGISRLDHFSRVCEIIVDLLITQLDVSHHKNITTQRRY